MPKLSKIKLSKIKGVIFDLDGVLVDSEELHYLAWVEVLKPLGLNFSKKEFFKYVGKQIDITAGELIKKHNLKSSKEKLFSQRRRTAIKLFKNSDVKMMPYAKQTLAFLDDEKKVKLGLASGGIKKIVIMKLKNAGLYNFFSTVVAGDDVKRGKPHPDTYLLAAKKMKLKPKDCLALEDTQFGVESAKSAGLFCFAIPNKYSREQNFSKADKIFKNLKETIKHIKMNSIC